MKSEPARSNPWWIHLQSRKIYLQQYWSWYWSFSQKINIFYLLSMIKQILFWFEPFYVWFQLMNKSKILPTFLESDCCAQNTSCFYEGGSSQRLHCIQDLNCWYEIGYISWIKHVWRCCWTAPYWKPWALEVRETEKLFSTFL